jgi:hypothetical protein
LLCPFTLPQQGHNLRDQEISQWDNQNHLMILFWRFPLLQCFWKYHHLHVGWDHNATTLRYEDQFKAKFCMPYESCMYLAQNKIKSLNSFGQFILCSSHIWGWKIWWLSGWS